jgi:hypothetical protein
MNDISILKILKILLFYSYSHNEQKHQHKHKHNHIIIIIIIQIKKNNLNYTNNREFYLRAQAAGATPYGETP